MVKIIMMKKIIVELMMLTMVVIMEKRMIRMVMMKTLNMITILSSPHAIEQMNKLRGTKI